MTRLFALAALVLALLSGVATATPLVDGETEHDLLVRINRERAERGLEPVRRDPALSELARFHSADMALGRFVAAVSPQAGVLETRAMKAAGVKDRSRVVTHVAAGTEASEGLGVSLLDPAVTRVGVGVVADEGRIFLTEVAVADAVVDARPVSRSTTYTAAAHAKPTRVQAFVAVLTRDLLRVPAFAVAR